MRYREKSFPVFPHSVEPRILTLERWNDTFSIVRIWILLWNTSITSLCITKHFFVIIFPLFYLSCIVSHNSHMFLYLNGIDPCIKHLYLFWNIRNSIFWREAGNKISRCTDDSKSGSFIPIQSEQRFKIQSHFKILDPVIVEGRLYDEESSQDLRCMCGLFGNIWFLY